MPTTWPRNSARTDARQIGQRHPRVGHRRCTGTALAAGGHAAVARHHHRRRARRAPPPRRSRSRRSARPSARRTAAPASTCAAVAGRAGEARGPPATRGRRQHLAPHGPAARDVQRPAAPAPLMPVPPPGRAAKAAARLLAIVEVDLLGAEDLVVLVPLAGDQHACRPAGPPPPPAGWRSRRSTST